LIMFCELICFSPERERPGSFSAEISPLPLLSDRICENLRHWPQCITRDLSELKFLGLIPWITGLPDGQSNRNQWSAPQFPLGRTKNVAIITSFFDLLLFQMWDHKTHFETRFQVFSGKSIGWNSLFNPDFCMSIIPPSFIFWSSSFPHIL
jgi:hypothetical protein